MKPLPENTGKPVVWEVSAGRRLMGSLPDNRDLVDTIVAVCRSQGIRQASFSIRGAVIQVTLGVFDPRQQVYVTAVESFAGEIVHCSGTISGDPAAPDVVARMAVADDAGNVVGGRLFSETLVLGAEIDLQEWLAPPMNRQPDPNTGLPVLTRNGAHTAGAIL